MTPNDHAPGIGDLSPLPIIIGGCFRTGTSLLRRILDAHSRIHCPPEVKFFRDLYGDYMVDDLANIRFFRTARLMGLDEDEMLAVFGGSFVRGHEIAAAKLGKARWADKNPENVVFLKQWDQLLEGRFQFVLMVRNPLDTLASMLEVVFKKTLPPELDGRIQVYRDYTDAGTRFADQHPERSLILRYEDLTTRPTEELARLMGFLGEEFEQEMIESFNARARQRGVEDPKVAANPSIHNQSIGRWRADLTSRQARRIHKRCKPIFERFDYEDP